MKIIRSLFFILGFGIMAYSAIAADQVKTTETMVADSDVAVSTNQSYPFTLYIGDDLTGVTNPIKSIHFTTSGVYTGVGTITFMIDGDGATSKTFTLPNVGATPTPFEIDYKDSSNKINPLSAGSYSYSLNFNPSGVTIYGLGIKMSETHRYVPPACTDGSPSNEKVKTTETMVADSDVAVSTNQSYPFTLYIGDDLTGVTNPIKSIHFTTSGVYTGSGTITFMIDGDGLTSKTFTLPNVGATPTPFEIDYKDNSNKINPLSAGSYSYSINFNPSGVTIYGLGIKMSETHRYKPPSCSGMPIYGDLVSAVFDSTGSADGAGYNSVMWKGTTGTGKVMFQFASSNCLNGANNYPICSPAGWNYIGSDGISCGDVFWYDTPNQDQPIELMCAPQYHNNQRYYRYKVKICSKTNCSDSGDISPVIDDIIINWAP